MKSCKLRVRVKFNVLVQIYSVGFLHLQLIHILALSPQVTVYLAWVLTKHIQVWNQGSLGYGKEPGWSRLHCKPFSEAQLLELWYRVLEALLYLVLTRVIWSSHADLSGSGSRANHSVFNTLSWHSPLAAVSRSTSIISLRLGSSPSLSSPFSSSCYVCSHCSAFLSC